MAALGLIPDEGLTPAQIYGLMGALDLWLISEMGELAEPCDLLVVGGAAVSLQWNPARLTNDIDVISDMLPGGLWEGAAAVAGAQEGVRLDWLNDAAKIGALSHEVDARPTLLYEGRTLRVYGAGARYVLAMKLVAGREVDLGDLPTLLEAAAFESLDDALEWTARAHSHRQVPVAAQYILEDAWEERMARVGKRRPSSARNYAWLSVRPFAGAARGWELVLEQRSGDTRTGGPEYPSMESALGASDFARSVLDAHGLLRFEKWEQGGELGGSVPGDPRPVMLLVPQADGWVLQVTDAGGERVATSQTYPTHDEASAAQDFLHSVGRTVGTPQPRSPLQVRVSSVCACRLTEHRCRHHNHPSPEDNPTPAAADERLDTTRPTGEPRRSVTMGVHVRPYPLDNQGWEVATTQPNGSPRPLSGPHPTPEEADAARDFIVRLVNIHPQLHILGWNPHRHPNPDMDYKPPPRDQVPTVGIYSPNRDGPWYVQCRNPDNTVDATSPPYPTHQAATDTLDQLGLLSISTTDLDLDQRVAAEPTSTTCRCSLKGWRCEHIEVEGPKPEYRGPSLGL